MTEGKGGVKTRVRYIGAVLLTAVILLFALQNLGGVTVDFLIWEFETSVSLIALVTFLAGLLVGTAATLFRMRKRLKAPARQVPSGQSLDDLLGAAEKRDLPHQEAKTRDPTKF